MVKNRLLSYLNSQLPLKISDVIPIRDHVFLVRTARMYFILKSFESLYRLNLQKAYTASLRKAGFKHSYSFCPFDAKPLYFKNNFYGCLEYITPHRASFTFHTERDRREGLELLKQYHSVSSTLTNSYSSLLPKANLLQKWEDRLALFSSNLKIVNSFVQVSMTHEIISWANYAMEGLKAELNEKDPPVILHGDVAHHNFIRAYNGQLYLIDFDLISMGPRSFDYLQYANRILPFIDWSLEGLSELQTLEGFLKDKAFLYGLVFPADILREWNRIIRENSRLSSSYVNQVVQLTAVQFQERKAFIKKLKDKIDQQ
ncbi:aminoglycoside phosphotransferase family protein [Bacillus sp. T33-2]|uniref:aminoglycoside phosphotransferase family protein n=1 Tax=Bacillus sp. T33-2 TaxID=2054168 RepID=UPI002155F7E2|nr:aminoglycoside phosphotransferase family protein [Bacillus sp. T33-2]